MANAFSIVHNYDTQHLYTPDFNFIQAGLSARQNKLDLNRAKLDALYDQFEMLRVHNKVDQDYVEKRLEAVHNITDKYANMDLSDGNFATSLLGSASQVLDDKVKNAIKSTRLIEAEEAQWDKMKTDKPDMYSDLNRAYAREKSDRANYEKSDVAGAVYRGGAGFIEYRDLSKKLMENLPKLQDMLHAKWVENGPGQGYFQSLDTYESVDRDQMNKALDMVFDEKDKMQLNVNAWGTYDNMSDEALQQEWEAFHKPELDKTNALIKATQDAKNDPRYKDLQEELDQQLTSYEDKKKSLEANTFNSVYSAYGREGLYTTLYHQQYKNDILDAYSYEKRLIERKVDEVQVENANFDLKLKQFDEQQRQFDLGFGLRQATNIREQEKWDMEKAKMVQAGLGPQAEDFKPIDYEKIDYDDTKTNVEEFLAQQDKSINSAKNTLKGIVGRKLTNAEFQQVARQLAPGNVDPDEKVTFKIGGKDYTIDMNKHYEKFVDVYNYVINDSPHKKEYYKSVKNAVWETASDLGTLYTRGGSPSQVADHLVNYQVKVIKNKKGEFEVVKRDKPDVNYFAYLVKKKGKHDYDSEAPALTAAEVKTLEMYTSMSMIMDAEQDDSKLKGIYNFLRDESLRGVKTNGYLLTYNQIRDKGMVSSSAVKEQIDKLEQKKVYGKLSPKDQKQYDYLKGVFKDWGTSTPRKVLGFAFGREDLSNLGVGDNYTLYKTRSGNLGTMGDYETRMANRLDNIDKNMESSLEKVYALKQVSVQSTAPGTKSHQILSELLGLDAKNKNTIIMQRKKGEEGKSDPNIVSVSYKYTSKKDGVETVHTSDPVDMDVSLLTKRGVPAFGSSSRTPYAANLGSSAAVIPMGNNVIDNTKKQLLRANNGGQLPLEAFKTNYYPQLSANQQAAYTNLLSAYQKGKFVFEVKAVQGNYYHTISQRDDKGVLQLLHLDPNPTGEVIYPDEVRGITSNSYWKNEELFLDFIVSQIESL